MYKLPISKYKNAAPKMTKRDQFVSGITSNRLANTIGTLINCSQTHVTFALDSSSGGSVCTMRHDDFARRLTYANDMFCQTHAHSGPITDIQYSTFNPSVLATTGLDSQIHLWSLSDDDDQLPSSAIKLNSLASLSAHENRNDCVLWNPNVENILVSASLNTVYLWDVTHTSSSFASAIRTHSDAIQGISWKRDGSLLCTTAKDKTMQVSDPRNSSGNQNLRIENAKTSNKDSRVVWLGTSDYIMSSVYTQSFQREVHLWDLRNASAPVHESTIDTGNNVLVPLFDYDTSVTFLIGKAESIVRYCEVLTNAEQQMSFALNSVQQCDEQIKGACMLPKFGLDLMKCEVDRLVLLTRNSIFPLSYFVPRRSYYDFHADVYPDTYDISEPAVDTDKWLEGSNAEPAKIPLNPATQKKKFASKSSRSPVRSSAAQPSPPPPAHVVLQASEPIAAQPPPAAASATPVFKSSLVVASQQADTASKMEEVTVVTAKSVVDDEPKAPVFRHKPNTDVAKPAVSFGEKSATSTNGNYSTNGSNGSNGTNGTHAPSAPAPAVTSSSESAANERKLKTKSVYYQSKFKYINGKPVHRNEQITNIRNLSTMWPSECNGFQINAKYAAFLLAGNSGQIGIVDINKPGRLPDTNINSLVNKSKISDFQWDPFDDERLAVSCDDGVVRIWQIGADGLQASMEEPSAELKGHIERLYCIKYHPYAKDLLATASYDRTVKLWNVATQQAVLSLVGHTDVIFSMSWSPCGTKLATICKDGAIRVYAPLASNEPILEAKTGPGAGSKAARIEWVLNGSCLFVSGFGRGNLRQIYLYESATLSLLSSEDISQSPSLLIPIYDADINVLYLYAKGEETMFLYEIQEYEPYFQVLSPYRPEGLHFAIAFQPKVMCDVRAAEVAKAYRLTKDNRIEMISFTVPRVKLAYFQDDIFPDTIDRQKPYLLASEWFAGAPLTLSYVSLQPSGMDRLSVVQINEAPARQPAKDVTARKQPGANGAATKERDLYNPENLNDDEKKIISSMLQRASLFYKPKSDNENDDDDGDWA